MITIELEFPEKCIDDVLTSMSSLHLNLRPTHFGEDEASIQTRMPLSDESRFAEFLARDRALGFFLFSTGIVYDFFFRRGRLILSGDLDVEPQLVKQFMIHMATLSPLYGFACVPAERAFRNRVVTKVGINTIESWVGRDSEKYVPGLYWLTLLSEESIEKHGVHLSAIEKVVKEHIVVGVGLHLFRLYDNPEDWGSEKKVSALVACEVGVFDIEKIKPWLLAATNFHAVNEVLDDWP